MKLVRRDRKVYCSKRHKQRVADINKFKEEAGCADCGQKYPGVAMDFHHRNGEIKEFNISNCSSYSAEKISREIKKCDVLCKNCHAIRTYNLRQHSKAALIRWGKAFVETIDPHPELFSCP